MGQDRTSVGEVTAALLCEHGLECSFDGRSLLLGERAIAITEQHVRAVNERGDRAVAHDVIENQVRTDWDLGSSRIFPIVREPSYYDDLHDVFQLEIADGLGGHLGFLGLGTLATMSRADIAALQVDDETVISQAICNLERFYPSVLGGADGLFDIEVPSFAPSFILLPDLLPDGEDGDRVVWLLSRDLLLVSGHQNRWALEQMRAWVEKLGHEPMVDQPYRRIEQGWVKHSL